MAESKDEVRSLLMKVKTSEKAGLTLKKLRSWHLVPITSRQTDGETMETVTDFVFWGSNITADGDCSMKLKDACSQDEKL